MKRTSRPEDMPAQFPLLEPEMEAEAVVNLKHSPLESPTTPVPVLHCFLLGGGRLILEHDTLQATSDNFMCMNGDINLGKILVALKWKAFDVNDHRTKYSEGMITHIAFVRFATSIEWGVVCDRS